MKTIVLASVVALLIFYLHKKPPGDSIIAAPFQYGALGDSIIAAPDFAPFQYGALGSRITDGSNRVDIISGGGSQVGFTRYGKRI